MASMEENNLDNNKGSEIFNDAEQSVHTSSSVMSDNKMKAAMHGHLLPVASDCKDARSICAEEETTITERSASVSRLNGTVNGDEESAYITYVDGTMHTRGTELTSVYDNSRLAEYDSRDDESTLFTQGESTLHTRDESTMHTRGESTMHTRDESTMHTREESTMHTRATEMTSMHGDSVFRLAGIASGVSNAQSNMQTSVHEQNEFDVDGHLEPNHSMLDSKHFRRDETSRDFIDLIFEKIEAIACEMDGEAETIRDVLDDVFEFFEDASCGNAAGNRKAEYRRAFESFLQKIDRLADLVPRETHEENSTILDILSQHFEKTSESSGSGYLCRLFDKELIDDLSTYFDSCAGKRKEPPQEAESQPETSSVPSHLPNLLSESDESGDGMNHTKQSLFKISEEHSASSDQASIAWGKTSTKDTIVDSVRLRNELVRRNNLRRLRGNIHGHIRTRDVVKKVTECRDTVNEAFGSAGEQLSTVSSQLSTIFEGVELEKLWESFILGSSNGKTDSVVNDDDAFAEVRMIESGEFIELMPNELKEAELDSQTTMELVAIKREDAECLEIIPLDGAGTGNESPQEFGVALATSSEDTWASGCRSGNGSKRSNTSSSLSKRFQKVNEMTKFQTELKHKIIDVGRLTPNSNDTDPTCDETPESSHEFDNDISGRLLKGIDSESSNFGRMEMLVYLSMHESTRHERKLEKGDGTTVAASGLYRALSLDIAPRRFSDEQKHLSRVASLDGLPPPRPTVKNMPPRLEDAPDEVFYGTSKVRQSTLLEGGPDNISTEVSSDYSDSHLGRASNRSNRSYFVQDAGRSMSACSIDEMPSIPYIPTAESDLGQETFKNVMNDQSCLADSSSKESSVCDSNPCRGFEMDENRSASTSTARSQLLKAKVAVDDAREDESHRANQMPVRVPNTMRSDPRPLPKMSSASVEMISSSQSAWFGILKMFVKGSAIGGKWLGIHAIKAMMILLYASVAVASTANDSVKAHLKERRRRFNEKMKDQNARRTHQMNKVSA